jgi:two-component system cell cycle response regulator DivK
MKKLLIADDNPLSRELISEALGDDYQVIEACNGQEALEQLRRERPDIALIDIQMPDLDGMQVVAEVRRDLALCHILTVALTAFAMQGDSERAIAAGFDAYITKPVNLTSLRERIHGMLADQPPIC